LGRSELLRIKWTGNDQKQGIFNKLPPGNLHINAKISTVNPVLQPPSQIQTYRKTGTSHIVVSHSNVFAPLKPAFLPQRKKDIQ
jgi:hypothetical protein